jgi:acetylornithine deacetylase/succinyl-diaminopimelate desuccinylase-like protein
MPFRLLAMTFAILLTTAVARAATDNAFNSLAHDIFKELIEIDTTDSVGNVTTASEAMAKRLLDAGFPAKDVQLLGPNERKKNLVVRFHGTGKRKPILLFGHLDVVEVQRENWNTDPFKLVENDGYFYGRGTADMKNSDAIMVATLIRLKREGFRPSRDIILALTADEEGGASNGVEWLVNHHRDLIDAEFAINTDGYSILADKGKALRYEMYGTEKVYADYLLTATNRGGHSSLPRPDNAIYELTDALSKLEGYEFPFELNDVTRAYYERMSGAETGERAADMRAILRTPPDVAAIERLSRDARDHATMRTTCVATRLRGGHANNALPQQAQATVNCRILPSHTPEEVRQALAEVIANPAIKVQYLSVDGAAHDTATDIHGFPPPALSTEVMRPLEQLVREMWPGIKVAPAMSLGASDAVFTMSAGLPTYNITGNLQDQDDIRAHGLDERIRVDSFYKGLDFLYRYLKAITAK